MNPNAGVPARSSSLLRLPSAFLPVAMSVAALATIGIHIAFAGTAPQPDEGTAAHIWQLLMALQVPIIGWFIVRRLPIDPRPALSVVSVQIGAALAAAFPIWWFQW
jgi:hypothetical protein